MKENLKKLISDQMTILSHQQVRLEKQKKGVIVLIEGIGETGKANLINKLITVIDPKYYSVKIMNIKKCNKRFPMLKKYFTKLPEYGSFTFFDTGWYTEIIRESIKNKKYKMAEAIKNIEYLEKSLQNNNYIVVKVVLNISKKEQTRRIKRLLSNNKTAWKVSKNDIWENNNYKEIQKKYHQILDSIEGITYINNKSKDEILYETLKAINNTIEIEIANKNTDKPIYPSKNTVRSKQKFYEINNNDYKVLINDLQKEISRLQDKLYKKGISTVIAFEGLDAAGKGGAIKRLSKPIDPRDFIIHPISAPTKEEKNRHFLYRFWNKIPKSGHIAIFDRTWYGRVLVERIEEFCTEKEYINAYTEINKFEDYLLDNNILVIKFWIDISKDEQMNRFNARKENPEKSWKLTDEDWRNREKWDEYQKAVNDMITYTSTPRAPWHIIDGNDKKSARILVLDTVASEMRKALNR